MLRQAFIQEQNRTGWFIKVSLRTLMFLYRNGMSLHETPSENHCWALLHSLCILLHNDLLITSEPKFTFKPSTQHILIKTKNLTKQ